MYYVKGYYPDSHSEWTENGYQIKKQLWFNDDEKITKIWRSQDSLNKYDSHHDIVWIQINSEKKEQTEESRLNSIKEIIRNAEKKTSKTDTNKNLNEPEE